MTVEVKITGVRQRIDPARIAKTIAGIAPGLILRRVAAGLDIHDRPFADYSGTYRAALGEAREDLRVDLRLTGGLLNSVKVRRISVVGDVATVTIAPDAGTSPAVTLDDGKANRTGKRGPPHNVVGYWIHHGTPRMRARPWLGLSPKDLAIVQRTLAAAAKK